MNKTYHSDKSEQNIKRDEIKKACKLLEVKVRLHCIILLRMLQCPHKKKDTEKAKCDKAWRGTAPGALALDG